jgi:hypothetical protein
MKANSYANLLMTKQMVMVYIKIKMEIVFSQLCLEIRTVLEKQDLLEMVDYLSKWSKLGLKII